MWSDYSDCPSQLSMDELHAKKDVCQISQRDGTREEMLAKMLFTGAIFGHIK